MQEENFDMLFDIGEKVIALLYIVLPLFLGWVHSMIRKRHPIHLIFTYYLGLGVGMQGVVTGLLQILRPEMVASYVQWTYSPFIIELGMANLSFGILGFLSFWLGFGGRIAAGVGYGLFLFITGIGHIVNIVTRGMHPGDTGGFLFSDFIGGLAILIFAALSHKYHIAAKSEPE